MSIIIKIIILGDKRELLSMVLLIGVSNWNLANFEQEIIHFIYDKVVVSWILASIYFNESKRHF